MATGEINNQNYTEEISNLNYGDVGQNNLENRIQDLPDDVVVEILTRLPAKPRLRFRCVSRTWNSLITHLINSLKTSLLNNTYVVLNDSYSDGPQFCSLFSLYNDPNVDTFTQESSIGSYMKLVGSCDGLICIATTEVDLVLWNPTTQECNKLPKIPDYGVPLPFHNYCRFGKFNDDYMILCFALCNHYHKAIVSIYSMRANKWKRLHDYEFGDPFGIGLRQSKFANGKVYWVTLTHTYKKDLEIGYLDLVTEEYGIISAPSLLAYKYIKLWVSEGCLYVFCGNKLCGDVWCLNAADESWAKVFTFVHKDSLEKHVPRTFHVLEISGEIMLMYAEKIVIFNITDNSFRYHKLGSEDDKYYIEDASIYIPSYISPFRSMLSHE